MSSAVDTKPVEDALKKFRTPKKLKGIAALIIKIDQLAMMVEQELNEITIEELADELPENSPRYVVLSYELNHSDGRKSFPLVLLNWAPETSSTPLMTLYASAFIDFQNKADISKVIEMRDGPESLTKEVIEAKLLK